MTRDTSDVVVVGAGIVGASVAYHLSQQGLRVTVIDASGPAAGATGHSSAVVRVHHMDWDLTQLANVALDEFLHWQQALGGPSVFTRTGFVHCFPPERVPDLDRRLAALRRNEAEYRKVGPEELRGEFPQVKWPEGTMAVWESHGGYADPRRCVRTYLDRLQQKGGRFQEGESLVGMRIRNGRLSGLQTTSDTLSTETVVVAAGAGTGFGAVLQGVGLPLRTRRIVAQRLLVKPTAEAIPACFDESSDPMWFRPDGEHQVIMGVDSHQWDVDPTKPQPPTDKAYLKEARERFQDRLHDLSVVELLEVRSGLDGYTPDQLPIVDRLPFADGIFVAAGFSGVGFAVAPAMGRCLATWITSGNRDALLTNFSLKRFADKKVQWAQPPTDKRSPEKKTVRTRPQPEKPGPMQPPKSPQDATSKDAPLPKTATPAKPDSSPVTEEGAEVFKKGSPTAHPQTETRPAVEEKSSGDTPEEKVPVSQSPAREPALHDVLNNTIEETPGIRTRRRRRRRRAQKVLETALPAGVPVASTSTEKVLVRQAVQSDIDDLIFLITTYIDFCQQTRPDRASLETLIRLLQLNPSAGRQFVALSDGRLVGFATLYFTFSTVHAQQVALLNDLFVAPDARRQGVGHALVEVCRIFVKDNGYAYMRWLTSPDNKAALAFYGTTGASTEPGIMYHI